MASALDVRTRLITGIHVYRCVSRLDLDRPSLSPAAGLSVGRHVADPVSSV